IRRMSSPGMYARCSAKSVDAPRCGERCKPWMNPSTTVRANSSRFPIRASTAGSRKLVLGVIVAVAVIGFAQADNPLLHPRARHRHHAEQFLDDLIGLQDRKS